MQQKVPVRNVDTKQSIVISVDSGAAENVMPEHMAPKFKVRHSEEQDMGVVYSAAKGETMPNRGKKNLKVTTNERQVRMLNMQVTDVSPSLMSVVKVCDVRHMVLFTENGGVIKNLNTGEETKFERENNVCRMN